MTEDHDNSGEQQLDETIRSASGEVLFYQTDDGQTRIECRFEEDTVWLTQALLAELYQKDVRTVNEHLRNIFEEGELNPAATIRKFRIVRQEGPRQVTRNIDHYSLDAVLAVGYRVRSRRGTEFRRWATERLREYLTKGFVMDDERLKNPPGPGVPDYFDELLERIRDIRASERRMYLRVLEIFALAADYAPDENDTTRFFQHMQNKLHYAATGHTAAELIHDRADHSQSNMGLTNWKGDRVLSSDVTTAKNYLQSDEITELNRIVTMWLDFAEDQARRRQQVFMQNWQDKLDQFLQFNDRDVLSGHGRVRKKAADHKARAEYRQFSERRRALQEAEGEEATIRALENVARDAAKRNDKDGGDNKA
ncbi:virulence RhuM family protein [Salinisphaera orenii]|uniref:virulence RhuM family protein n=1 Tax=Salinisphaera orenii TaxID=856731 RepID=UPI000DBE40FC